MDAITLLERDHDTVEKLFRRFEKAGDNAIELKRDVVDRIIEELSIHAAIEEQLFYPVARYTVDGTEDIALESIEEHHIVKWVLSELETMNAKDERFDAKVTVLIELVRHHVEEEEGEFFPKVRRELGPKALDELGDALASAKRIAPTHPHPRAPDTPPGNVLAGAAAGMADRVGDTVGGVAEGAVSAVQDLIAKVRGSKPPATKKVRGTSTARKAATKTRSRTLSAAQKASDAADKAAASTRKAGRKASGSAGKLADRTKATAKRAEKAAANATKQAKKSTAKRAGAAKSTAKRSATKATKATKKTTKSHQEDRPRRRREHRPSGPAARRSRRPSGPAAAASGSAVRVWTGTSGYPVRHGTSDLDGGDQLRVGERPGEGVHRSAGPRGALPSVGPQHWRADQVPEGLGEER